MCYQDFGISHLLECFTGTHHGDEPLLILLITALYKLGKKKVRRANLSLIAYQNGEVCLVHFAHNMLNDHIFRPQTEL